MTYYEERNKALAELNKILTLAKERKIDVSIPSIMIEFSCKYAISDKVIEEQLDRYQKLWDDMSIDRQKGVIKFQ